MKENKFNIYIVTYKYLGYRKSSYVIAESYKDVEEKLKKQGEIPINITLIAEKEEVIS